MARMFGRMNRPKRCKYRCCLEFELRHRKRKSGFRNSENKQWKKEYQGS